MSEHERTAIVRTIRERFRRWWSQFNQGNYPPDFDAVLARMDAENGRSATP